jgi:ankyrin repeat protein
MHGANANAKGGPYGNALQAAAVVGNVEVLKLLLDAGADINARGEGDCTALQVACFVGNADVVHVLLPRRADARARGGKHGSAMKAANDHSHFDVIKLLADFRVPEENSGESQQNAGGSRNLSDKQPNESTSPAKKASVFASEEENNIAQSARGGLLSEANAADAIPTGTSENGRDNCLQH